LYDPKFVINDDDNAIINDTDKRSFLLTMYRDSKAMLKI
jgi:hypothetical protein